MSRTTTVAVAAWLAALVGHPLAWAEGLETRARARYDDLRLSAYVTAGSVQRLAADAEARQDALPTLRRLGIRKVYLEVYRGGTVVSRADLERVRDLFAQRGFAVAGGIATVPGGDFGVRANAGLHWFNWQNEKTQQDLERVIRATAPVFDEFIVDDFLCTGDTSTESDAARGDRSWSEYRRDLLTRLSEEVFIRPAKEANPDIRMLIKYPQWYDRFHLFGYDVVREPPLFDAVWVGTETRGAQTQRFGFTQPYQGFINYRWLCSLAGGKVDGAWFDHGDCEAEDFVEQAWQTVLAGAPEIVLFNFADLAQGHPGHARLREDFDDLANLAKVVRRHPVRGVGAYKPPHSDAGSDLYLLDVVGMLGIPVVPYSQFPADTEVIFLPTQAAADPQIEHHVASALRAGKDLVFTAGFIATVKRPERYLRWAGLQGQVHSQPVKAETIWLDGRKVPIKHGLGLHGTFACGAAKVVLEAEVRGNRAPFLTEHSVEGCRVTVLNTHTYSQADFEAVGEVLLPPSPLGLLEVPSTWARELRRVFGDLGGVKLRGPTRVTLQPLGKVGWFVQNYNNQAVTVELELTEIPGTRYRDGLSGESLVPKDGVLAKSLPARSRWWVMPDQPSEGE